MKLITINSRRTMTIDEQKTYSYTYCQLCPTSNASNNQYLILTRSRWQVKIMTHLRRTLADYSGCQWKQRIAHRKKKQTRSIQSFSLYAYIVSISHVWLFLLCCDIFWLFQLPTPTPRRWKCASTMKDPLQSHTVFTEEQPHTKTRKPQSSFINQQWWPWTMITVLDMISTKKQKCRIYVWRWLSQTLRPWTSWRSRQLLIILW